MNILIKIFRFLSNKYVLTTLIFLVIIGLLDKNSLIKRLDHHRQISTLESEIAKYKSQHDRDSSLLMEISSDPSAMEKVARERYFMKKENEDVYVFEGEGERTNE